MGKIYSIARFKVHPGKTEAFRTLAAKAIAIVKEREPETLFYEWFLDEAGTDCMALDCYTGFPAMAKHIENIGPTMREILQVSDRTVEIYGDDPTESLTGKKSTLGSHFIAPLLGGKI